MFRLKKRSFSHLIAIFSMCVFSACSSIPDDPVVEFSKEKSYEYSLDEINILRKKNLSLALSECWRLCNSCDVDEKVFDLYFALIDDLKLNIAENLEKKELLTALRDAKSLEVLESLPKLSSLESFSLLPKNKQDEYSSIKIVTKETSSSFVQKELFESWKADNRIPLISQQENSKELEKLSSLIPGTVTIWVDKGVKIERGQGILDRVIGSGFFIDTNGYIITNYHVISSDVDPKYEGYSRVYIKMSEDSDFRIPAKVIGWDAILDLALIKAEVDVPCYFKLGSSSDLDIGDRIYAIGSPAGLEKTLTSGVVSVINRRIFSIADTMQIDAPINHGNSGGPIIDRFGRVQAIVFAGIENYEGLNFAIPVELLKMILPDLYNGGEVTHPWIGAWGKNDKTVNDLGNLTFGASALYVLPGSPASIAGLKENSVITACNDIPVSSIEELQKILLLQKVGSLVKISTQEKDFLVALEKRPLHPVKELIARDIKSRIFLPTFGMKTESVNSGFYPKFFIQDVLTGSNADESGLSPQDPFVLREFSLNEKLGALLIQIQIKRRKSGYMEVYLSLGSPLDSPNYF